MTREFSLAHLTLLGCAPVDLIEVAARTGYSYVSLRPIAVTPNEPKYPFGEDKAARRAIKQKLACTGVRLLDIELARIIEGHDPVEYIPALEAAAELGGHHVLSSIWTRDEAYYTDKFGELCDLAKPFGLTVSLEFVTFASIATLPEAVAVLQKVDRDNAAICVDTLHFYRSGDRPSELVNLPDRWFKIMQLCDATNERPVTREELIYTARADRRFCGEGGLDLASVVNRLPEIPYSLEIPNAKLALELSPIEFAQRAIDSANRYLDRHPLFTNYSVGP